MEDYDRFNNLPRDPELAFLELEEGYRNDLERLIENSEQSAAIDYHCREYMNNVIAIASELGIEDLRGWEVPNTNISTAYGAFSTAVKHHVVRFRLRHARRQNDQSVRLTPSEKARIRSYIEKIRTIVEESKDTPAGKKEAVFKLLAALTEEVDRDRTRMEVVGAVSTQLADAAQPWWKYDKAGFGGRRARQTEGRRIWRSIAATERNEAS
jgi:hypothetical protein